MKKIFITAMLGFVCAWSFLGLPSKAVAANNCRQWSQSICRDLGAILLSCGYTGPAVYAEGLVINKTPLQRKGFRLESGSYTMTVTRIDKIRYIIGVKSLSDPSRYQEKQVMMTVRGKSLLPDRTLRAPVDYYFWNAAIEYDLKDQLGLIPAGKIPGKLVNDLSLYVALPEKISYFGLDGLRVGDSIRLNYQGNDRWQLIHPVNGSGLILRYLSKTWMIVSHMVPEDVEAEPAVGNTDPLFENSDFEDGTLTNWKATGKAFDNQPTLGDNIMARRRGSSNHQGRHWVGTYENYTGKAGENPGKTRGDNPTGTLTSVKFEIMHDHIALLVGGGRRISHEYVALLVNGREVLKVTGSNKEEMKKKVWDVSAYKGKTAQIRIKDNYSHSFGHINVDDFRYHSSVKADKTIKTVKHIKTPSKKITKKATRVISQPVQNQKEVQQKFNPYDGWFPFPEYGWTTSESRVRSIPGSLLEVKKTYTRGSNDAVVDIIVTTKKSSLKMRQTNWDNNEDMLPQLIETILGEVLSQTGSKPAGNSSETITHQGINGLLKVGDTSTTLEFEDQGTRVVVRVNKRDRQIPLLYGQKLDLTSLGQVFAIQ
ncbi:MAG: hypothetical protein K8S13_10695 [Desulfobacula sp.]|uniref:hypothetical protein n=1 Tax=Desulfobacula sp. TaxID=2593537 RepID=UPI0025C6F98C|nr:hypothetical protein [Desulfobacula sp.]MCD4720307.1 hypothetical protein [Desulfobacula sp.]